MAGTHPRNTRPMRSSPRCGAKTRRGTPCQSPAVFGKGRCRMHGGALGSGAPKGNNNAFKHGAYTKEARAQRALLRRLMKEANNLVRDLG
ncbi:MAG TPA: HGGxSTG domain-containing protein [Methyloceanibacter sp.]|nr:HGGxSTG domain-containing protein [Methyloceanibacter sp.]